MRISVYRLNTKIRSTMICLSFELYSRLVPLFINSKVRSNSIFRSAIQLQLCWVKTHLTGAPIENIV